MSTTPFHSPRAASQATRCSRSIDFARWPIRTAAALALSASSFASSSIQGALPPSDLFQSLRSFELLAVAPPAGNPEEFIVDVQTAEFAWTLSLKRHSVWAPDARMTLIGEAGVRRSFPMAPSHTYRGEVLELPGSSVSAAFTEDGFSAIIDAPGVGRHTLEPTGLGDGLTVFFGRDDVRPMPNVCGAPTLEDLRRDPRDALVAPRAPRSPNQAPPSVPLGSGSGSSAALGGESYIAELAIDADYEYFLALNSSPSQVQARIAQVMNSVDIRYERDLGITHAITELVIRTSSNDPYTSTDPLTRLNEMRTWWRANQSDVDYDLAQLFTGVDLDGDCVGIAFARTVCGISAYGVNQRLSSFNSMVDLLTHEMGHNWGARHCDEAAFCDTSQQCNYMCSSLGGCDNVNDFGPCAESAINAFRATLTNNCIETTGSPVLWVKLAQNCPFGCSGTHGAPYRQIGQVVAAVPAGGQLRNVRVFAGTTLSSGETWPIVIDRPMTVDVFRGLGADPSGVVTIERP